MRQVNTMGLAILAAASMAGCTTVQKWMGYGSLVGAPIGGIYANNFGTLTSVQGAAIGAGVGLVGGALIGDAKEERLSPDALAKATKGLEEEKGALKDRIAQLEKDLQDAVAKARGGDDSQALRDQIASLERDLRKAEADLDSERKVAVDRTKELQAKLDGIAKVGESARGITLTIFNEILFDSGKAALKSSASDPLAKVAAVIKDQFPNNSLVVEGHTDNQPIQKSGWNSNWELSGARALNVLHYLNDQQGFDSTKLSFAGYGEFQPIAANETLDGRRLNRRAVIVILPETLSYERKPLEVSRAAPVDE